MRVEQAKFTFFIFVIVFLSPFCRGQMLEWSNTQKIRGNSIFTSVIGEDESGIYILRHRNKFLSKFILLERYRHNLGLENSKSFLLKNTRILFADINETGIILIKQVQDKKTGFYSITSVTFNSSFDIIIPETVIMQLKQIGNQNEPEFFIQPTPDHTQYVIVQIETDLNKFSSYQFVKIDQKQTIKQKGHVEIDPSLNLEKIANVIIDKNLDITMLAASKRNKKGQINYVLIEYFKDSGFVKPLHDPVHIIDNMMLYYNPIKDEKFVSGFYSSNLEKGFEGDFFFHWKNLKKDSLRINKQAFSFTSLKELEGETKANQGFLPITYEALKLIGRSDGGFIKLCENAYIQRDQEITLINGIPSSQGKSIYNYENILIRNFDSTGKVSWEGLITKNQNTVNDGGLLGSVFVSITPSSIHMIYNDPIAIGGDITIASFLPNGDKDVRVAAKGDEMNAFIIPSEGKQIASDKIIIPVLKDRKFALLKITFKE